jgi:3-hydroxyacyl-CoA dehydrogenase
VLKNVRTIALVGAGTIGGSWAVVYTRAGLETRVYDPDEAQRAALPKRFEVYAKQLIDAGLLEQAALEPMRSRFSVTGQIEEATAGAQYVQESVPEQLELKRSVFATLDRMTDASVVIGSSVSAIPMSDIVQGLSHPERCIGVHPTNPPHIVPLVEIIPSSDSDPALTDAAVAFMKRVGQVPIVCRKELYGFVLNRIQMALVREALYLYREGVASAIDIDRCVQQGLGLRWAFLGPFGIEHTNSASIEDDLRKFGQSLREIFASVNQPYDGPSEEDIAKLAIDVEQMFAGKPQPEIVDYRNRMVLAVRKLKQEADPYV